MISVLILTRNEERNLPACLESVRWSDDIVVVDSHSSDGSTEIARAAGARVFQRPFDDFAAQRNFGVTRGGLKHHWILHLDADERVTPALHRELVDTIRAPAKLAYRIPSRLIFRGKWLKHAGQYPAYQVRFGRREALTFEQVGHGQRETLPAEDVGTLREPLIHDAFTKGMGNWFERHNRYSTSEARYVLERSGRDISWTHIFDQDPVERRRSLKELGFRLPLRPLARFLYVYFGRLGFLDGRAGFTYSALLGIYEYMIHLKADELRANATPERIAEPMRVAAD